MATQRVTIVVTQRGAAATASAIRGVGTAATGASRNVTALRNALTGIGVGLGLREIVRSTDAFINLSNAVRLGAGTAENYAGAMRQVFQVSTETRAPVEATAELYRRLALNTRDLGDFGQDRIFALIKTINQAVAVSGATAQEARNGLIQLAQGFASGQLRGEEFRAVAEQLPRLLIAIADGTGKSIGELRRLAFEGALTPKIVAEAIETQTKLIATEFQQLTPTIEQAGTQLSNAFIKFLGDVNNATKGSLEFGKIVGFIADNISRIATLLVGAGVAWGAYAVGLRAAQVGTTLLTGNTIALTAAIRSLLVSTVVGSLLVALTLVIDALLQFGLTVEEVFVGPVGKVSVTGFAKLGAAFRATLNLVESFTTSIRNFGNTVGRILGVEFPNIFGLLKDFFVDLLGFVGDLMKTLTNNILRPFFALGVAIGDLALIAQGKKTLSDLKNDVKDAFQSDLVGDFFESIGDGIDSITKQWKEEYNKEIQKTLDLLARQKAEENRLAAARTALTGFGGVEIPEVAAGADAARKKRLADEQAAINRLIALQNSLRRALAAQIDPLDAKLEKLRQQEELAVKLAIRAGDERKAAQALNLIYQSRIRIYSQIENLNRSAAALQRQILADIQAINAISPQFAADLQKALQAALLTAGGLEDIVRALRDVARQAGDTRRDLEDELGQAAKDFGQEVGSQLTSAIRRALRGEGLDIMEIVFDQGARLFEKALVSSLERAFEAFRKLIDDLGDKLGTILGGSSNGLGKAFGAAIGVASLFLEGALAKTKTNTTRRVVSSAVESTQATRGVVAGPTEISIFQVGASLEDALEDTNSILRDILLAVRRGNPVAPSSNNYLDNLLGNTTESLA